MATKWLLVAGLVSLAVPLCCGAVGQVGQAGLHGPSGLNGPVAPDTQGATVGEVSGTGLGMTQQAGSGTGPQGAVGTGIGVAQQVRERSMNRETAGAGTTPAGPPEQPEEPSSEGGNSDEGAAEKKAPNATHRPPFISALVETGPLTEDQVGAMRTAGAGWGAIRISGLLADQIAANAANDEETSFDTALGDVLAAREEGMGFGAIALVHDLKVGHVVGKGH